MSYKIAMLLKPAIAAYCKAQFPEPGEGVTLCYFPYSTMQEFETVCRQICDGYDGIVTSGLLPDTVLSKMDCTKKICRSYFRYDIENTYRLILCLLLEHPELSVSQIGIDGFHPNRQLDEMILNNRLTSVVEGWNVTLRRISSYEEMEREERKLAENHLRSIREGQVRYVLSASLLVTELLEQAGCSCGYIYPSPTMIRFVIEEICHAVDLKRARGSLPAIIRLDLRTFSSETDSYERAQSIVTLKKKLTEFAQTACQDLTLKSGSESFEFYTDRDTLEKLTLQFSFCPLPEFLGSAVRGELPIGCGVGATFYQARANAINACGYSRNYRDEPGTSFLIDEADQLISLSKTRTVSEAEQITLPADYIKEMAYQVKLAPKTLFKIAGVLRAEGTDEISSEELIGRLGVSLRTANHYLSNLTAHGKAAIVGQKRPNGRGPHINIYKIDMPY